MFPSGSLFVGGVGVPYITKNKPKKPPRHYPQTTVPQLIPFVLTKQFTCWFAVYYNLQFTQSSALISHLICVKSTGDKGHRYGKCGGNV